METAQVHEKAGFQQWLILIAVGLGTLMFSLDVHIVNIALPTLVEQMDSNLATVEWVPVGCGQNQLMKEKFGGSSRVGARNWVRRSNFAGVAPYFVVETRFLIC